MKPELFSSPPVNVRRGSRAYSGSIIYEVLLGVGEYRAARSERRSEGEAEEGDGEGESVEGQGETRRFHLRLEISLKFMNRARLAPRPWWSLSFARYEEPAPVYPEKRERSTAPNIERRSSVAKGVGGAAGKGEGTLAMNNTGNF